MKKVVKKEEWTRSWSTKYPIVFLEAFADGYTKYAKKYFGRPFFQPIIFEYNKGVATVYRKDKEIIKMQGYFSNALLKDKNFLKDNIAKMFDFFKKVEHLNKKEIFGSVELFQTYFELIAQSLALYIMMIWAPDGISRSLLSDSDKNKFIKQCSDARKKTEYFYPDLVNIFEIQVKKMEKQVHSNIYESLFASNLLEIKKFIKQKKISNLSKLLKRFEYSVFIKKGKQKIFLLDQRAKKFINKLIPIDLKIQEIKGTVAMKGKVTGSVKVLLRDEDLIKFRDSKDTILVSTMTRPEWIQVMHTSSAFITDAGGMLCHAAIVARELKKPCIIGTKIATKVLKDGDLVEVDAEKGVVTTLKRAK